MSQRRNDRNRNRDRNSNSTRRESLSHPYWTIAYYFINALRTSTPTLSTPISQSQTSSPPYPPLISQNSSFPIPPPQNPHYYPNPISPPYLVCNNSIFPLDFTTESINNLASIFRNTSLSHQNINLNNDDNLGSRTSSRRSSLSSSSSSSVASSSGSHVTSGNEESSYNGIKGKGRNLSHIASFATSSPINFNFPTSVTSSPLTFSLDTFPYTLSTLEKYEIQIRIEGKISPINIISPRQLNKLLINCKNDHETKTNSQGNIYCKKRKNVYHYHNLSNASFYSKREDGSSIYVNKFGDITYKAKEQEDRV
ncbi:hypothetical protein C1645_783586 [Glomus cerebriforme]|uniref:Uncharacterized protein n=1 Tax=Glomus cerebriforme TaxID=658196 RepID=A0A397SKN7_9GLOM|nr:hypothetical protein C1645_783586 [Glomus cerebriforme]